MSEFDDFLALVDSIDDGETAPAPEVDADFEEREEIKRRSRERLAQMYPGRPVETVRRNLRDTGSGVGPQAAPFLTPEGYSEGTRAGGARFAGVGPQMGETIAAGSDAATLAVLPTVAAAGPALAGSLLGPGGTVAGLAAGMGLAAEASRLQADLMEPETNEALAEEAGANPKAAFAGQLLPQLLTARPDAASLKALGGAAGKLVRGRGGLETAEKAALGNAGFGAGLAGGLDATQSLAAGEELSPGRIAASMLAGGALTKPQLFGKLGSVRVPDAPDAPPAEAPRGGEVKMPSIEAQDAALDMLAKGKPQAPAAKVPDEVSRGPVPPRPIHEMTADELYKFGDTLKAHEESAAVEVFGPERAKEYERLQRTANSSIAPRERVDAASAKIQEMESGLTPAQEQRLFGFGETGPNHEDVRYLADRLGAIETASDPQELGEFLGKALSDIGDATDPAKMNQKELAAFASLRRANTLMAERGWDPKAVSAAALRSGASRFSDPADAAFMLKRFLKPEAPIASLPKLPGGYKLKVVGGDIELLKPDGSTPAKPFVGTSEQVQAEAARRTDKKAQKIQEWIAAKKAAETDTNGVDVGRIIRDTEKRTGGEAQATDYMNKVAATGRNLGDSPVSLATGGGGGRPGKVNPVNPFLPGPGEVEGGLYSDKDFSIPLRWARTGPQNLVRWSLMQPADRVIQQTKAGQGIVRNSFAAKNHARAVEEYIVSGSNEATNGIGLPQFGGMKRILESPAFRSNEAHFADWIEGKPVPPTAKAALDASGIRAAWGEFTSTVAKVEGLDPKRMKDPLTYWRHMFDRDSALANYATLLKDTESRLAKAPRDKALIEERARLRDKVHLLKDARHGASLAEDFEMPNEMHLGYHKTRAANFQNYMREKPAEVIQRWARITAHKSMVDAFLPAMKRDLLALKSEAQGGTGGYSRLTAKPDQVRHLPDWYVDYTDKYVRNVMGYQGKDALLESFNRALLGDNLARFKPEDQARAYRLLNALSYNVFVKKNPGVVMANAVQWPVNGLAYFGERSFAEGTAQAARYAVTKGGPAAKVRAALRLGHVDVNDYGHTQDMLKIPSSATEFWNSSLYGSIESAGHLATGTTEYLRFNRLANAIRAGKKLEQISSLNFLNDPQRPVAEQYAEAAAAVKAGDVEGRAMQSAQRAIDDVFFRYGTESQSIPQQESEVVRSATRLTSWFPKEADFVWNRLNKGGKARFILYPLMAGGTAAVPFLNSIIDRVPSMKAWRDEAEDGRHGEWLKQFLTKGGLVGMAYNKATGATLNMERFNPLSLRLPGQQKTYRTKEGAAVGAVAGPILDPFANAALSAGIRTAEGLIGSGLPGAERAAKTAAVGSRSIFPIERARANAMDPRLTNPFDVGAAALGITPPNLVKSRDAAFDLNRAGRDARNLSADTAKESIADNEAAATLNIAMLEAGLLPLSGKEYLEKVERGGLKPEQAALLAYPFSLGNYGTYKDVMRTFDEMATEGDGEAAANLSMAVPKAHEWLKKYSSVATGENQAVAVEHLHEIEALAKKHDIKLGPVKPVKLRSTATDPAMRKTQRMLAALPDGTDEEYRSALLSRVKGLPRAQRDNAIGYIQYLYNQGKLSEVREALRATP